MSSVDSTSESDSGKVVEYLPAATITPMDLPPLPPLPPRRGEFLILGWDFTGTYEDMQQWGRGLGSEDPYNFDSTSQDLGRLLPGGKFRFSSLSYALRL
ncbi:hypothetical protein H0H92_015688 [Tricholoma furcatifolium]|nr:hypothetical protein H0H92_015688 [Tricholoma furcatifolium]